MEHRPHEGEANHQYLLQVAACSHRSKGRTQAGMQEQNNIGTPFRTTLFTEVLKLALHNNSVRC